jgi:hypothetical protein
MIKLIPIVESIIKEGGKLFGARASRVTTAEMNAVFSELKSIMDNQFDKMVLSRALKTKETHGDIDVVIKPKSSVKNLTEFIKTSLGDRVLDYVKNGNIHSVLYSSPTIGKSVHIDFLTASTDEAFESLWEYLSFNDFSGILGVFARRMRFVYGTEGFIRYS